jgi:hypothetical protein
MRGSARAPRIEIIGEVRRRNRPERTLLPRSVLTASWRYGPEQASRHFLAWSNREQDRDAGIRYGECLNFSWFWNLFDARKKFSALQLDYDSQRFTPLSATKCLKRLPGDGCSPSVRRQEEEPQDDLSQPLRRDMPRFQPLDFKRRFTSGVPSADNESLCASARPPHLDGSYRNRIIAASHSAQGCCGLTPVRVGPTWLRDIRLSLVAVHLK